MVGTFRAAVRSQADVPELERALARDGMVGLLDQAAALVAQGVTSVEEVSTVLGVSAEVVKQKVSSGRLS